MCILSIGTSFSIELLTKKYIILPVKLHTNQMTIPADNSYVYLCQLWRIYKIKSTFQKCDLVPFVLIYTCNYIPI